MRRTVWASALLVVLALGCEASDSATQAGVDTTPAVVRARVAVQVARPGRLEDQWRYLGEVQPHLKAQLAAGASGEVKELRVRVGDRVRKGQLLLRVDAVLAQARLAVAQAERLRGREQLAQAERDRARSERLGETVVAPAKLEQDRAQAATVEAELQGLDASAQEAEAWLERHRVLAPFDAVVAARHVDPGDWVDPGVAVLDIVGLGRVEILVRVTPELMDLVDSNAMAMVSRGDQQVQARVSGLVPALGERSRTATVRLEPVTQAPWLLPGLAVDVAFSILRSENGVVVSRDAVVLAPTHKRVMKIVDGQAQPVVVEVLATAGSDALVRGEGLTVGDQIVVRGNERLKPGQPVELVGETGAPRPPEG